MSDDPGFRDLARYRALQASGSLTSQSAEDIASSSARAILEHHAATGETLESAIQLLCEMATLEDEDLASHGLRGLFTLLVERLSDSFDPELCPLYDRVFAQVVDFCRGLPEGRGLDAELTRFDLETRSSLLGRRARLLQAREAPRDEERRAAVRKVLIPSRVTLGAEVAVTSVVMAKMKRAFPHAEIVLLAAPAMAQIFAADQRVRVREVGYAREGGLIQRLDGWIEVVRAVDDEIRGLDPSQCLVVDPDSRLTQLGLLPLTEDDGRHHFFQSRSYRRPGVEGIGPLAACWLNERFGGDEEILPYLALSGPDLAFARQLCGELRRGVDRPLVVVSFGVGGNPLKRLHDPFEAEFLDRLLDGGAAVILIKGVGEEELRRSEALVAGIQASGKKVVRASGRETPSAPVSGVDLLAWEGPVGAFCALIGESDAYVGYDSAGQHIAAALGVPTVDIFADSTHPLVPVRWHPYGPSRVEVIRVHPALTSDTEATLDQVMEAYERALAPS